jgi:hypothetical protein
MFRQAVLRRLQSHAAIQAIDKDRIAPFCCAVLIVDKALAFAG